MKSPFIIAGLDQTGKTSFICSLLRLAWGKKIKGAAFKPFDSGLIKRNATEQLSDGEKCCQMMQGQPMETLVSPYLAHEDYPLEMSFRRDGIRIKWSFLKERLTLLNDLYDFTCVEVPGSLFTPVTEGKMVFDWIVELKPEIFWLIHPVQNQFNQNLAELRLLKELGLDYTIIFNNISQQTDQDLLFYIWEKTEKFTGQEAAGMIPFISSPGDDFAVFGENIEKNLPVLIDSFLNRFQAG